MSARSPNNPLSNPFIKYNLPVKLFFCWLEPLFCYGARHTIRQKDLYSHQLDLDSEYLLKKFTRYWNHELRTNHTPQLWRPLAKCLWWRVFVHGILSLGFALLLVVQSILLGNLTDYFTIQSPSSTQTRDAYLLGLGLTLLSFLFVLVNAQTALFGYRLGMLIRIILTSAIYKKTLSLNQITVTTVTVGQIVNLASNDVHRFDLSMLFYHFFWVGPIHLTIVTYFVYREIGPTSFLASFLIIALVPLQLLLAKLYTNLRLKTANQTDERVKVMNEVITGIRVIKMYGWEDAFQNMIAQLRNKEVKTVLKASIIRAINLSLYVAILPTIMFVIFSVYGYLEGVDNITAKRVFTTLSLLTFVRLTSVDFLLEGIILGAEGVVALKRILEFSLLDEQCFQQNDEVITSPLSCPTSSLSNNCVFSQEQSHIIVTDLCASWTNNREKLTLTNITFTVNRSSPLIAIIGAVGSGKSTLLQCLIDELRPINGTINKEGSIAYCAQEPWIFSATLRDNILFGEEYECEWYNTVIGLCALDMDLELLPHGDLTFVGERGVTLSGGQKARVSLARAVYRKAGVYLLDDPLSAVDAAVSRHMFDNCIRDVLCKSSIVVLVTHQIQYIHQCDVVLGLKEGQVQVYGTPSEILTSDFAHLINDQQKMDTEEEFSIDVDSNIFAATVKDQLIENEIVPDETGDTSTQLLSAIPSTYMKNYNKATKIELTDDYHLSSDEEINQGTVGAKTYYKYFIAGGGYLFTAVVSCFLIIGEVTVVLDDWWLSDWADCSSDASVNRSSCDLRLKDRIGIYGLLTVFVWVFCVTRTILFYILALRAARVLHNRMFTKLLRAPVLFFDTNPVGRILNRFSKDIGFLDNVLIFVFIEFFQLFIHFLAIMVTAIVSNPYLLIVVAILLVIFALFRWYYLKTAREIKRIEAVARSPLYSHISMTIQGLSTIRAYHSQEKFIKQFHSHQNSHTQVWDAYVLTSRWFGLRIDIISTLFVAAVAFMSIPLAESVNGGLIGLALTYAISLNGVFQYCIRQSAEVESYMVSTERILAYSNIIPEKFLEAQLAKPLPIGWPYRGHIEITDLSYRHSPNTPMVLKCVNCVINSGEKVGIVGRTGAGKSSLIASFFRLAEPSGSIRIDGIECFNIGLHDLRPNISIIPQDPVLFSGTVRYNLDPFNQYDDEQIWTALRQVQLSNVVDSLEGGLEASVTEGGNNFSVGQRQLFCLARALLKHNKILMLDEATANVDLETDSIIQQVIRDQFSDCTVLTIAHRLDTVMDSDKIMVLSDGKLLEYDQPRILLSNPDSYLLKLVEKTGQVLAEKLKRIAANREELTISV